MHEVRVSSIVGLQGQHTQSIHSTNITQNTQKGTNITAHTSNTQRLTCARSPSYFHSLLNSAPSNLRSTSSRPLVGCANIGLSGIPVQYRCNTFVLYSKMLYGIHTCVCTKIQYAMHHVQHVKHMYMSHPYIRTWCQFTLVG